MTPRRFPLKTSIFLGFLFVAVGTGAGIGVRSAVLRAREEAAIAVIDAKSPKALRMIRASEDARLHAGPFPIERAMDELATRGRMGLPSQLLPQSSTDVSPLAGWGYLTHDVPAWMLAAPDGGPAH